VGAATGQHKCQIGIIEIKNIASVVRLKRRPESARSAALERA